MPPFPVFPDSHPLTLDRISSNDKLKKVLPSLLADVHVTKGSNFTQFYKWVFDHFRDMSSQKRSISNDFAFLLFKALLYPKKYESPFWKPDDGCGEERHVESFCNFLEGQTLDVSKDEYNCFGRFNFDVKLDFEGWNADESTCKFK